MVCARAFIGRSCVVANAGDCSNVHNIAGLVRHDVDRGSSVSVENVDGFNPE
jgi:hypothetical protein